MRYNFQNIKLLIFLYFPRFLLYPALRVIEKMHIKKVFRSQSNESQILENLIKMNLGNQQIYFFEFGFDPTEFNCAKLSSSGHEGNLVDLDQTKVRIARKILNKKTIVQNKKIEVECLKQYKVEDKYTIVSIDIDGNDYEFAREAFLNLKPEILICEYNAIYLDKRIKVPFDKNFNRRNYHVNYYGCSLTSLLDLAHSFNYCCAGVSLTAVNAFFIPSRFLSKEICASNLEFGLNQNYYGTISKDGTKKLDQMFTEIESLKLENLDHLKYNCTAN